MVACELLGNFYFAVMTLLFHHCSLGSLNYVITLFNYSVFSFVKLADLHKQRP